MTPSREKGSAAKHRVEIQIKGKDFAYAGRDGQNAATIHVRRGDHVTWLCAHGNYSVLFKQNSPFADVAVHGRRGDESVSANVVGTPGSYHYGVTVALDGGLVVDDPEIIIDNDA